jgi:Tol biopolymer transport system component
MNMKRIIMTTVLLLAGLAACTQQTEIPPAATTETSHPGILRVVYSKNADPWLWTEGEGPRRLADSVNVMEVVISSDGQVVVFKRDDTGELFAVNADGSDLHPLVNSGFLVAKNAVIWAFDFVPGSHTVLFTMNISGGAFQPYYDLYRVNTEAAEPSPSLVLGPGQGGIARFSPDGRWMALYHLGGLELAQTDGSLTRTVFTYPEGYEPATFGPDIAWLADSSGFAVFHVPDPLMAPEQGGLWFVPVAGDPVERTPVNNPWGIPSPDGRQVGFERPGDQPGIHIVTADGSDTFYRTSANASFRGWSPDSQHFLLALEEESENGLTIQTVLGALGAEPVPLTEAGRADPVFWVTADEFLFVSRGELRLQRIGEASTLLDDQVYNILDFILLTP